MNKKSIFVSEREPEELHQKVCRRCNKIYRGGRQSKYCMQCYKNGYKGGNRTNGRSIIKNKY